MTVKDFTVDFQRRNFAAMLRPPEVVYSVRDYSWAAVGGPDLARVDVTGQERAIWDVRRLFRAPMVIYDWLSRPVWWGYVHSLTIKVDAVEVGLSLDEMYNDVTVTYTLSDGSGAMRYTTTTAQNGDSVGEYGQKQLLASAGELSTTLADALASRLLNQASWPVQTVSPGEGGEEVSATLEGRGWWHTLDWQLFQRAGISCVYDGGSLQSHSIGSGDTHKAIAVEFTPSSAMTVRSLWAYAGKVGNPTDSLRVSIVNDNAGKPTGSVVTYGDVAGTALSTAASWGQVGVTPVTLSAGVKYWYVMSRPSGTWDANHHFVTQVDTGLGYAGQTLRWNANDWGAPYPNGDLVFRVYHVEQTTDQIAYAIENAAQFLQGVTVENDSGVYSYSYANGDLSTLAHVLGLLAAGTANQRRLLAQVTVDRWLRVYEEPAKPTGGRPKWAMKANGTVKPWLGDDDVTHACPVGDWCELVDAPPLTDANTKENACLFFLERAEFSPKDWKLRPEPRQARGAFDVGMTLEG